jgi:hypothetical protein
MSRPPALTSFFILHSSFFILHSTKQTADKADPELPGETGFVALDAHAMHQRHEVRNALGR